jgi:hypothetical protein
MADTSYSRTELRARRPQLPQRFLRKPAIGLPRQSNLSIRWVLTPVDVLLKCPRTANKIAI